MVNLVESSQAELDSLTDKYLSLRKICPDHQLLRFATLNEDGRSLRFSESYLGKYVEKNDQKPSQGYSRYRLDLEAALG